MKPDTPGKRVAWTKTQIKRGLAHKKYVYDDEATFYGNCPNGLSKRLTRGKQSSASTKPKVQRLKVNVWGAISYAMKPKIEIISGNVNAQVYKGIIERNMKSELCAKGDKKKELVSDNAPWHRAKLISGWLGKSKVTRVSLPPYSPDLNPIENFWGLVATNVYAGGRNFADAESLQKAIMNAVANFP